MGATAIAVVMLVISFVLLLILPLAAVFTEALRKGWSVYVAALLEPDAVSALKLTLLAAALPCR